MSRILDTLKKLDRERLIRPSGTVKIDPRILKPALHLPGKEAQITDQQNSFLHIFEMISAHADLGQTLGEIVKECFFCVRAHRVTIFIMDDREECLQEHLKFIYSLDPHYEEMNREEEEAIARESFEQYRPFLLQKEDLGPRSAARNSKWDLTAIMTFPFATRHRPVGTLSAVLFNGRQGFDERSLQLFSRFARLPAIAIEMDNLFREVGRKPMLRRDFENYLDKILAQLGTAPGT